MKKHIDRCMGCMSEKLYKGPCKACGYIDNNSYPADCLAPGTLLEDRYVVGKMISKNGEGVVYLAFDTAEDNAVEIKEFLPDTMCRRAEDGLTVEVNDGSLPLFKSYLSEFADLHKSIITDMRDSELKQEFSIFSAGNTGYVVTEHPKGMTLSEYLENNGGKISWDKIRGVIRPVIDTLGKLHQKGIVHRGISPETLFVTKDGRLIMTSVDISAARTADSQINSEMFEGYAACEQYALSERQGSWTDVYAVCAVLYNVLTGTVPPSALSRKENDTLVPPSELDSSIPSGISDAIMDGMNLIREDRIHDTEYLSKRLFGIAATMAAVKIDEPESDGPITPKVSVKLEPEHHTHDKKRSSVPTKADIRKKQEKKKKMSNAGTIIGLVIFLTMVAALIIAIIYFAGEAQQAAVDAKTATTTTEPEAVTTTETTTERTRPQNTTSETRKAEDILLLPDFVNRFFNPSFESRYSMLVFEAEYEYSDEYSEGIIYEQDIPEGTQVRPGTVIHIKVSKGAAYTYLPDYIGQKLSEYSDKLNQLGIRYEIQPEETSEVKAGYVIRCSKEIDDKVYISENEIITVYYAVTPAVTTTTTAKTKKEERPAPATTPDEDRETTEEIAEE